MRLYRSYCVRPGRKPQRPVFSRHGSYTVEEHDGLVVECQTRNQEFLGSNPMGEWVPGCIIEQGELAPFIENKELFSKFVSYFFVMKDN